jgi:hypothetical protein
MRISGREFYGRGADTTSEDTGYSFSITEAVEDGPAGG